MKFTAPTRGVEMSLRIQGHGCIAGVDEVGRGALAGPVVVAAVLLPSDVDLPLIRDSKVLNFKQREVAAQQVRQSGARVGIGWTHAQVIDVVGLTEALRSAALQALGQIAEVRMVLLDGKHNYLQQQVESQAIIGGDRFELVIAAASVVAKVARDQWMTRLHDRCAKYGFDRNVGYGTPAHLAALGKHGPSKWHRQSFAPVANSSSRARSRDLSKDVSTTLNMTVRGGS